MSQPVQNNPYGLSPTPLPLIHLHLSSPRLSGSILPAPPRSEDRGENNGKKKKEHRRRDPQKVRVKVSSYSDCIEHDVHLYALYCAALPFMLIDFQMMLGRNQWDTASTRNASPLEESCS